MAEQAVWGVPVELAALEAQVEQELAEVLAVAQLAEQAVRAVPVAQVEMEATVRMDRVLL